MLSRKDLKSRGKDVLKRHYAMFVTVCLVAAFLHSEFSGSLYAFNLYSGELKQQSEYSEELLNGIYKGNIGFADAVIGLITNTSSEEALLESAIKENTAARQNSDTELGKAMGRSRGIFAQIANAASTGSTFTAVLSGINSIVGSGAVPLAMMIGLSLLIILTVWFFINNLYVVISRRLFLEGRIYEKLPMQRFMFLIGIKKWLKASFTMFVTSFFMCLWFLTIIGAFIKKYSYFAVPYIVAENPNIGALEAIRLSKKMMNGHKWECFILDVSFIGWFLLGFLTLGFSSILYSNPYKVAAFCEYYTLIRENTIKNKTDGADALCNKYLFEKAPPELLKETYGNCNHVPPPTPHTGFKGFFEKYLGISLLSGKKSREYEELQEKAILSEKLDDYVNGLVYPTALSPFSSTKKRERLETMHYMRSYSIWTLIALFFIFSFIGWVWEMILCLINHGELINRGVLHGPWLPIYGGGGVLILTVLYTVRKKPALLFICTVILCGVVEYYTSYFMEVLSGGTRWWDYSGYFLNLNGRICAEGLITFGLGGMAISYMAAPALDNLVQKIRHSTVVSLCVCLVLIFSFDCVYSLNNPNKGHGVTDDDKYADALITDTTKSFS